MRAARAQKAKGKRHVAVQYDSEFKLKRSNLMLAADHVRAFILHPSNEFSVQNWEQHYHNTIILLYNQYDLT